MRKLLFVLLVAGCSSQNPSPNPPPSWGVPITGGTMLVTRDGSHAVIADPDRDRVLSVDLTTDKAVAEVPLAQGDEPGRLIEDAAGRIHVALRQGGAVVTLADAATLRQTDRTAVCAEPRGLAYDQTNDLVHVACNTGELVSLPAGGGAPVRVLHLDRGLRDVLVSNGNLYVSRFREAELLQIDAAGNIAARVSPPVVQRIDFGGPGGVGTGGGSGTGTGGLVDAIPAVAWRTIAMPNGQFLMVHQRQLDTILHETQGGYGGGCGQGPDETAMTIINPGALGTPVAVQPIVRGALPVDVATDATGGQIAIVTAGNKQVHVFSSSNLGTPDDDQCGGGMGGGSGDGGGDDVIDDQLGAPTSAQFTPSGDLVIYYPELPALSIHHGQQVKTITLPGDFGYDAGRALFHTQTQVGLACASCHPEGRDDGLVWQFENEGTRRTQSIAGHILERAPYHWAGDMPDLTVLMDNVFAVRMAGPTPTRSQHMSLGPFLERIAAPAPGPVLDAQSVARGKELFNSAQVGCATCHSGPLFTNHQIVNVGTGGAFKVPSLLGIGARAPFLHDGSAPTLAARFGATGGGDLHGHTAQLRPQQIQDLVAYLNSL